MIDGGFDVPDEVSDVGVVRSGEDVRTGSVLADAIRRVGNAHHDDGFDLPGGNQAVGDEVNLPASVTEWFGRVVPAVLAVVHVQDGAARLRVGLVARR
jgi:hypothetical protein